MAATPVWLAAAEAGLNRGIRASAPALTLCARLDGASLRLQISGLPTVVCGMRQGRLRLTANEENAAAAPPPEATLAGTVPALLALARGKRASVRIEGDAEVADGYRRLFAAARPDLEEALAGIIGDFPARRVSRLATRALAFVGHVRQTAAQNVAEYLQEESRDLVGKVEVEEFLRGVDALREQADRIEARLARLERLTEGSA